MDFLGFFSSVMPPLTLVCNVFYFSAILAGPKLDTSAMLDFIIAVKNPLEWHCKNMRANLSHYSLPMRYLGPASAAAVQTSSFGAKVYFNTLIRPSEGPMRRSFKYGVISVSDLERDLTTWNSLYVAGRMHKPVWIMSDDSHSTLLQRAMKNNLVFAASAALLTLPQRFREIDLYMAAANLSYAGDVRMTARAEVRNKVHSIVKNNFARFRNLYSSAVEDTGVLRHGSGIWERQICPLEQQRLLTQLPHHVSEGLRCSFGLPRGGINVAEELSKYDTSRIRAALLAITAGIVTRSSMRQSLKGVLTAGVVTSFRYIAAKVAKAVAARGQSMTTIATTARSKSVKEAGP